MNILINGISPDATIYGYALSKGHKVFHLIEKEEFEQSSKRKIRYNILDQRLKNKDSLGEYIYNCVDSIDREYEFALVVGSEKEIFESVEKIEKLSKNINYLLLGTNWSGVENIEKIIDKNRYILGDLNSRGLFKGNLVWGNLENYISMGKTCIEQEKLLNDIEKSLRKSYILAEIKENIVHYLWIQNISKAPMAMGLSKYPNMNKFIEDKDMIDICFKAMDEGYKIAEKRGVDLRKFMQVQAYTLPIDEIYPLFKENVKTNSWAKRHFLTMTTNIEELKKDFDEIYKTGKKLKIDTPNMDKLNK